MTPKPHTSLFAIVYNGIAQETVGGLPTIEDSQAARRALRKLEEQLETLQDNARRFLVVTSGPPERIEDVGKARRELVDALHASNPASERECPRCEGRGRLYGQRPVRSTKADIGCPDCGGTGKVSNQDSEPAEATQGPSTGGNPSSHPGSGASNTGSEPK